MSQKRTALPKEFGVLLGYFDDDKTPDSTKVD